MGSTGDRRHLNWPFVCTVEKPFDLVLSRSTSCSAHLPALLFCREARVQWIANWNDPPPYLFPPPYCYQVSKVRRLGMRRYFRAVAAEASFNTFPSQTVVSVLCRPNLEFGMSSAYEWCRTSAW